jgi:hypothetical protein
VSANTKLLWKLFLLQLVLGLGALVSCALIPPTGDSAWPAPVEWSQPGDARAALTARHVDSRCQWCGESGGLEVHHIIPQWKWADPTWEDRPAYGMNDPTNLVTLCRQCHFVVGQEKFQDRHGYEFLENAGGGESMKATLEFNLPEDENEFRLQSHGVDWALVAFEMDACLRRWLKHGHNFKTADEALEGVREALSRSLESRGVSLEDIR